MANLVTRGFGSDAKYLVTRGFGFALTWAEADTVNVTDDFDRSVDYYHTITDTVTALDNAALVMARVLELSDTVSASDLFSTTSAFIRTLSDTVAVSDDITTAAAFNRALADGVILSDSMARAWLSQVRIDITNGIETLSALETGCVSHSLVIETEEVCITIESGGDNW